MDDREALSRSLVILGTSGLAREVLLVAMRVNENDQKWDEFLFVGPRPAIPLEVGRYAGTDEELLSRADDCDVAIGIGEPRLRARVLEPFLGEGSRFNFPNLVHPRAVVEPHADRVVFGCGNVICAGATFTCDIHVGDFNHFNLNSTVGHDAIIGSANVINPGANISGGVRMGDRILVGTGVQILENVVIENDVILGAGALAHRLVAAGQTVVGVPARPLER